MLSVGLPHTGLSRSEVGMQNAKLRQIVKSVEAEVTFASCWGVSTAVAAFCKIKLALKAIYGEICNNSLYGI